MCIRDRQELWELPAGKLEKGEDPFEAAKRELEEECGLTADKYTSPVSYTHLDVYKRQALLIFQGSAYFRLNFSGSKSGSSQKRVMISV